MLRIVLQPCWSRLYNNTVQILFPDESHGAMVSYRWPTMEVHPKFGHEVIVRWTPTHSNVRPELWWKISQMPNYNTAVLYVTAGRTADNTLYYTVYSPDRCAMIWPGTGARYHQLVRLPPAPKLVYNILVRVIICAEDLRVHDKNNIPTITAFTVCI